MKKLFFSFVLALFIVPCLMVSAAALTPEEYDAKIASDYSYTVLKRTSSTLAPGITQDTVYAKWKRDGNQIVFHVLKADIYRDDVRVYVNYKDNQWEEWGLSKLSEQLAAAQAKHSNPSDTKNYIENYTVVAGVNGDYYEMSNGRPLYAFGMEGHLVQVPGDTTNPHNPGVGTPFFGVEEGYNSAVCYPYHAWQWTGNHFDGTDFDGTDWPREYVVELIGGDPILVNCDDENINNKGRFVDAIWFNYDVQTDLNARTAIGLNHARNQVIMVVVDGKQLPYSRGASTGDLGQIMVNEGCWFAMNLDGGGSSTMIAKAEGSNDLEIVNKPCDGYERIISSSLMVVSTYKDVDAFDHAVLTPEHDYVTPGSSVKIDARGSTLKGAAADLPANGTWQLASGSAGLGSIENGVFTSGGTTGDVTVQYMVDGVAKGTAVIHVVTPDAFAFTAPSFAVPFGKTIELTVTATYKDHEVALRDSDVTMTLSDSGLGTLNGSTFTAVDGEDEEINGSVTATLTCANNMTATAALTVGKGSVVIFDFDDPASSKKNFSVGESYPYLHILSSIDHVTAETGKVHDGTGALAITLDYSEVTSGFTGGVYQSYIYYLGEKVDYTGATGIGAWVWVPDEEYVTQLRMRAIYTDSSGTEQATVGSNYAQGTGADYDEGHWFYVYMPLTDLTGYPLYYGSRNIMFDFITYPYANFLAQKTVNNKLTFYVDSITVDYSSVVDDRDAPVFGDVTLNNSIVNRGAIANSGTGSVSVQAGVADSAANGNATGISASSAVAYVDGVKVSASYRNGIITMDEVDLAAGVHTIVLGIEDNAGNYSSVTRQVRVTANTDVPTVKVVAHDPNADKILIGSLYYIDVIATSVDAISEIEMDLDLNNISTWELDHATVDPGFEFNYTIDEIENIAALRFVRIPDSEGSGQMTLASLPIRTWTPPEPYQWYDDTNTFYEWNMEWAWAHDNVCPTEITVDVDRGVIVYSDGYAPATLAVFGGTIQVDTELYDTAPKMKEAGKASWHVHDAQPDNNVNFDATCTEEGFAGRTWCEECESVVEWGGPTEALGHDYQIDENDLFQCTQCDDLYTGTYGEDGSEQQFVSGVLQEGWLGDTDRYYRNGEKLSNGYYTIDGKLYYFNEDGECENRAPFTGEYGGRDYIDGEPKDGWLDGYYYENGEMATGFKTIDGILYHFADNGVSEGPYTGEYDGKGYIDGVQTYGWVNEMYFDETEGMLKDGYFTIDEKLYWFDENGECKDRTPFTGEYEGEGYIDGEQTYGWVEDMYFDETEGMLRNGYFTIGEKLYWFDEDGICEGQRAFTGEYEGKDYINGKIVEGWTEDDCYYVDGVKLTGIQILEDLYFDFGENGVCEGRSPITDFFELDGDTYYAVAGELETGWFSVGEDRYHAEDDGRVHGRADAVNTTTCTEDGRWEYTCLECGEQDFGQILWSEGHNWDKDYICTKCGTEGHNIAEATLTIAGAYFSYTGEGIRAAHTVTYNGKELRIRSDRMGTDGYAIYSNNIDIGVATLTIEGRGDFYGELTGTFTIVPASIGEVIAEQAHDTSLTLQWDAALGADLYEVYRQNGSSWLMVGSTQNTSYNITGLTLGDSYAYRVASVATRNGTDYYCTRWADISGTLDHMWGEVAIVKQVTCTEDGLESRVCTDCGERTDVVIPALGHNVKTWKVTKEATTSEAGSRHGICGNCGEDIEEVIPKLPSTSSGGGGGGGSGGGGGGGGGTAPAKPEEPAKPSESAGSETSGTTTVEMTTGATTSGTTAKADVKTSDMNKAVDSAVTEAAKGNTAPVVEIVVTTSEKAESLEVALPVSSLKKLAEAEDASLVITSDVAEVALDTTALDALVDQITGSDVTLKVTPVAESALSEAQKELVGGSPVVDLSLMNKGVAIHDYKSGKITVSLPYTLAEGQRAEDIVVYYLEDDGSLTPCSTSYKDGKVTFTTTHLSKYVIGSKALAPEALVFPDVVQDAYYAGAVVWAAANGITQGNDDGTFAPDRFCTRAEIVTFLWNAAGNPEVDGANPFRDVAEDAYYYKAVLWAAEKGIAAGITPGVFSPDAICTRAQAVAFLHRAKGSPVVSGTNPFTDVLEGEYYYSALLWAAENGVANGITPTTFCPDQNCTRAQIVSFLYRTYA